MSKLIDNLYPYYQILLLILTIFIFISLTHEAKAADEEKSICRYVRTGLQAFTSSPKPEVFKNVDAVYLIEPEIKSKQLSEISFFTTGNILELAMCVNKVRNYLNLHKTKTRHLVVNETETINDAGNLIIFLRISKKAKDTHALLETYFYRKGFDPIESLKQNCVQTFSYSEDEDILLQSLTSAMSICLRQPYYNSIKDDGPDPDFTKLLRPHHPSKEK